MKSEFGGAPEKRGKKTEVGGVEEEELRRGWFDLEEKDDRLPRSGIFSGLKKPGGSLSSAFQEEGQKGRSLMWKSAVCQREILYSL